MICQCIPPLPWARMVLVLVSSWYEGAHVLVQVGITTDIVAKGDNAAATSPFTDFTKQQLVQVHCHTQTLRMFRDCNDCDSMLFVV